MVLSFKKLIETCKQRALEASHLYDVDREIQLLLSGYLKCSWGHLVLNLDNSLESKQWDEFLSLWQRRLNGEPRAYILNEIEFYGLNFFVDKRVLIPRPETELIVTRTLDLLGSREQARVVDLGCGSGCIGLTLAKMHGRLDVVLVDASSLALEVAKKNRNLLGMDESVKIVCETIEGASSWPQSQSEKFDVVVANPPYIAKGDSRVDFQVHDWEPHDALYAEHQGKDWIYKWIQWSECNLKDGGFLLMEVGLGQVDEITQESPLPLNLVRSYKDYSGNDRILHFEKGQ